ncbi:MAG: hypothetical protein V3R26_02910 [Hyphomicrobium sp.]
MLEIPTPRWTAYDAKRFGIQAPDESALRGKAVVAPRSAGLPLSGERPVKPLY